MKEKDITMPTTEPHKKGRFIFEDIKSIVNEDSGQVVTTVSSHKSIVNREPNFIKLYLNTMMAFQGIEGISSELLICMCNHIQGFNNSPDEPLIFRSDKITRSAMAKELNVKDESVKKYIKQLKDSGILLKSEYQSVYYVNPWLLARGDWKNINSLRTNFNIVNGEWQVQMVSKKEEQEITESELIDEMIDIK